MEYHLSQINKLLVAHHHCTEAYYTGGPLLSLSVIWHNCHAQKLPAIRRLVPEAVDINIRFLQVQFPRSTNIVWLGNTQQQLSVKLDNTHIAVSVQLLDHRESSLSDMRYHMFLEISGLVVSHRRYKPQQGFISFWHLRYSYFIHIFCQT